MAAEKEVKAQVKLRFKAANGKPMMVVRSLSVTLKKTSGMTMKTLEAMLSALPQDGENDGKVRLYLPHHHIHHIVISDAQYRLNALRWMRKYRIS